MLGDFFQDSISCAISRASKDNDWSIMGILSVCGSISGAVSRLGACDCHLNGVVVGVSYSGSSCGFLGANTTKARIAPKRKPNVNIAQ